MTIPTNPSPEGRPDEPTHFGPGARVPGLDGLRAISILLVIASHAPPGPVMDQLGRIDPGNLGVRVFFVISGFLITTLLLREHERTGSISLGRFYFRRTMRIMPPYYVYLAVIGLAAWFGHAAVEPRHLVHAATYTSNYLETSWLVGHSWSLSVEEQFYIVWPGLLVLAGFRGGFRFALALLVLSPLLRAAAHLDPAWPTNPRYAFETVADALATGCLLARYRAELWGHAGYRALLSRKAFAAWPLVVLVIAAIRFRYPFLGEVVGVTALNVALAIQIDWCLRNPESPLGKLLNARPVAFIGVLSYSIYLWQQPFMAKDGPLPWPLILPAITACALASYYLVERPSLQLRTRLERRLFP